MERYAQSFSKFRCVIRIPCRIALAKKCEMVPHLHPSISCERLRKQAHVASPERQQRSEVSAIQQDGTSIFLKSTSDRAQSGCLSGAVRSDDRNAFAFTEL